MTHESVGGRLACREIQFGGRYAEGVLLHTAVDVVGVSSAAAEHVPASDNSEKKIRRIGSHKFDRVEPGRGPVL